MKISRKRFLEQSSIDFRTGAELRKAAINCGWKPKDETDFPTKSFVASLTYHQIWSIGHLSMEAVTKWLAADGLTLREVPVDPIKVYFAEELLKSLGYTVVPPES